MFRTKKRQQKLSTIGRWTIVKQVGLGATAKVYYGVDNETGRHVAVKVFNKLDSQGKNNLKNEAHLQSSEDHNNLLKLVEFHEKIVFKEVKGTKRKSKKVAAIVVEFAEGGDILELMQKIRLIPEKLARTYFHQLISGIEYMSNNNTYHRDIKPENLLLDQNFCIKIADFGCAIKTTKLELTQAVGTSKYHPPEIHERICYQGLHHDLFSSGVVLFSMLFGHMPFSKAIPDDICYKHLISGKPAGFWKIHEQANIKQDLKVNVSSEFKDLINKMLSPKPSNRLAIPEIKDSEWFKGPTYQPGEIFSIIKELSQPTNNI